MIGMAIGGWMLIAAGVAAHLYVRRRKFYRRNLAGLYEFQNFRSSLGFEWGNRAIILAARLGMLLGGCLLILSTVPPPDAWVEQPQQHQPVRGR